jgi:hypothetical protein
MAQFGTFLTAPGVQVKIIDGGEKEQSEEKPTPTGRRLVSHIPC